MVESVAPHTEVAESGENYGRFVVEPLENGFGVTLGNALRRVLLSSLRGAAVTAVRIEGVHHEFSTVPHVKEDVIEFLLNIKEMRLRPLSERPGRLTLDVAGEGRVCAGDISPSADYEVVNPELHLLTLDSPDARFSAEFYVEQGRGYVPAGQGDGQPIGVIPVDATFTPVHRVNYRVEKTRVGQRSDYDRLLLEVWTDGTITPNEALAQSAQLLVQHFTLFYQLGKGPLVEAPAAPSLPLEQYEIPLEQLNLTVRTLNALRRSGIMKVGELVEHRPEELLRLRSFGQKSLEEVAGKLDALGLKPTAWGEAEIEEAAEAEGAEEAEEAAEAEETAEAEEVEEGAAAEETGEGAAAEEDEDEEVK